jgi:hypothetical protein
MKLRTSKALDRPVNNQQRAQNDSPELTNDHPKQGSHTSNVTCAQPKLGTGPYSLGTILARIAIWGFLTRSREQGPTRSLPLDFSGKTSPSFRVSGPRSSRHTAANPRRNRQLSPCPRGLKRMAGAVAPAHATGSGRSSPESGPSAARRSRQAFHRHVARKPHLSVTARQSDVRSATTATNLSLLHRVRRRAGTCAGTRGTSRWGWWWRSRAPP